MISLNSRKNSILSKRKIVKRFNKIDLRLSKIENQIESLRKENKADMESLKKDQETGFAKLSSEITKSKNEALMWVFGLFVGMAIAILFKL